MIRIKKSTTADTRTCDWSKGTKEELILASRSHILDVQQALSLFADTCSQAGNRHDFTKIRHIDEFHADFSTGFKQTRWWDMHREVERHHLSHVDGVRPDVDLIDVLEYIADCVMAGKARTGQVSEIKIDDNVLRKAFENTWRQLADKVEVVE